MISVLCTKWGEKYGADFVNILYSMVKKNYDNEFKFYCFTEKENGLDKEVNVIPINDDLELWWNKLYYFKEEDLGQCLAFDLDLIIQNDISPFVKEEFHMIKCFWKDHKKEGIIPVGAEEASGDTREVLNNSSIMSWKNRKDIWEKFDDNRQYILDHYATDDRWMHWQNVKYETYQRGLCYSYIQGSDFYLDNEPELYRPDYHVCIFHQDPKQDKTNKKWVKELWK
jgi:hypothetical protein